MKQIIRVTLIITLSPPYSNLFYSIYDIHTKHMLKEFLVIIKILLVYLEAFPYKCCLVKIKIYMIYIPPKIAQIEAAGKGTNFHMPHIMFINYHHIHQNTSEFNQSSLSFAQKATASSITARLHHSPYP